MWGLRLIAAAAAVALSACSGGDTDDTAAPSPSEAEAAESLYEAEIVPILIASCATCHLTGQEAGEMALVPGKAIESLVNIPAVGAPNLVRVLPGDPDKSYLVMKLEGTQISHDGSGAQMPFGAPPLPPGDIAKFRKWIAEGAKP